MSQIPLNAFDKEDKEIIGKVNKILSVPESELNSIDKQFVDYLKYIFWTDFGESNFTLPKRKKEKNSYLYLKDYIEILFILFQKDKNEREALYKANNSCFGDNFSILFKNLKSLIEKKNTIILNINNLKDKTLFIMYKYFYKLSKNFPIYITLYYFSIYFFIPKIKTPKLLLYNLLKENFSEIFDGLDYKEFFPDFDNNNCLNLIQLYFLYYKDRKFEILPIYAYLIFRYKYIFVSHEKEIDFKIMQKTVVQILDTIKSNNISGSEIGKFINSNFIKYLENNTKMKMSDNSNKKNTSFEEKEKSIETKKKECDKPPKTIFVNKLANTQNRINNKNEIKESLLDSKERNTDKTNENLILNDNEKSCDVLVCHNNYINTKENNNTNNKKELKKSNENFNGKENSISSELENNKLIFGENTEKGFLNGSTGRKSTKIEIEDNFQNNNIDNDKIEEKEKEKDFLSQKDNLTQSSDNNKALFLKVQELENSINVVKREYNEMKEVKEKILNENNDLRNEIKNVKKENNKQKLSIKELKNKMKIDNHQMENEIIECKNKINKNSTEIGKLKKNIKEIKTALGSIQVRDYAKSFLNQFRYLLTNEDRNEIEKDSSQKWKIILHRVEIAFQDYKQSPKYESIMEIFRKSLITIEKSNMKLTTLELK